ncbi:MAG: tetratricopeptide repeat protein [Gemmatimonadaceae bacterium]
MMKVERDNGWAEMMTRNWMWLIAALAIAASISGITNGFAFDDVHLIVENDRLHSIADAWRLFGQTYWPPVEGASLYRPLTMLAFSAEWFVGSGAPLPFHMANIALYVLVCLVLARLLRLFVDAPVAILAAALFAVHPVHTEAVANIVGQSELLVALFLILAVDRYLRARLDGNLKMSDVVTIGVLYLAACLSKEHGIILPGLLLGAEILVPSTGARISRSMKRIAPLFICLIIIAIAFVVVRTLVTHGFRAGGRNELFGSEPYSARIFTMLTIVMEWLRLLFWPAQMSADYSFPRTHVETEFTLRALPGAVVIAGCAALAWRTRVINPVVTFAILWIAVTLAIPSNLVIMTGFVLAERTLFLASAAVTLMAGLAIVQVWKLVGEDGGIGRPALIAAFSALLVLGVVRSASRNPVWHDNLRLFAETVENAPSSARAHWMLAEELAGAGQDSAGADEIELAVALGRKDDFILLGFAADQLQASGMCPRAVPLYGRAVGLSPQNEQLRTNASLCLVRVGKVAEARAVAVAGLARNHQSVRLKRLVAQVDSLEFDRAESVEGIARQ